MSRRESRARSKAWMMRWYLRQEYASGEDGLQGLDHDRARFTAEARDWWRCYDNILSAAEGLGAVRTFRLNGSKASRHYARARIETIRTDRWNYPRPDLP